MLYKGSPRATLAARTYTHLRVQSCIWKAAPPELLVRRVLVLPSSLFKSSPRSWSFVSTRRQYFSVRQVCNRKSNKFPGCISRLRIMARQSISIVATICFLAIVCVHVDAMSPSYTPMMAPEGAPIMPPVGSPMTPPPMVAAPPMNTPTTAPQMSPVPTPSGTPVPTPSPVAMGPGPMPAPASSASSIVPTVAFALLGAAAFFF